ncbi:CBS domain-containing protein [Solilutibacter tolerans]|uniref:CBS domain-containing protein n=1 Tax=Solilutibacter tolerans TaxID=1604334 RepID=A0A1N6XHN5_9GAMM|nr:CBS domain-containing protein [Lysobacter tolerans]SIR01854.1 CBS domain-containing protein [Lysobacter tolerans]
MSDITSVMTSNPSSCRIDTPLADVAQMMVDSDCGMIPVVDEANKPIGAVTDRDIATRIVAAGIDAGLSSAGDAMTSPVKTVTMTTSLYDATCVMEAEKIRRVIVVDGDGQLAGVAALADLALAGKSEATAQVVKEVSEPGKA